MQDRNDDGHVHVIEKENHSLYGWILNQRKRRRGSKGHTTISEAQVELLDNIGFEWESELYDALWIEK